jgi:hypothetical protein
MSYGCAKRRDERRKSAIQRTEALIAEYKKPQGDHPYKKEVENAKVFLKNKIESAEKVLKDTQANMGKGTCAMQKNGRKPMTDAEREAYTSVAHPN